MDIFKEKDVVPLENLVEATDVIKKSLISYNFAIKL